MSITRAWITVKLQDLGLSFLSGALSFVRCSLHQISSYLNEKIHFLIPVGKYWRKAVLPLGLQVGTPVVSVSKSS